MAQGVSWGKRENASSCISNNIVFPGVGRMEPWGRGLECQSVGSSSVWVFSSQCLPPGRGGGRGGGCPLPQWWPQAETCPGLRTAKHQILYVSSETQPEADIAIAPPAGSLEKDSETPSLALTSSSIILVIVFKYFSFCLMIQLTQVY